VVVGRATDCPALFGNNISMSDNRNRRLYDLSVILRWLRHREKLASAAIDKMAMVFAETGFSTARGRILYYHKHKEALNVFIKQVELDIRTITAGCSGDGLKGRKRKCQESKT
jgi:hypothetical protein